MNEHLPFYVKLKDSNHTVNLTCPILWAWMFMISEAVTWMYGTRRVTICRLQEVVQSILWPKPIARVWWLLSCLISGLWVNRLCKEIRTISGLLTQLHISCKINSSDVVKFVLLDKGFLSIAILQIWGSLGSQNPNVELHPANRLWPKRVAPSLYKWICSYLVWHKLQVLPLEMQWMVNGER